MTVYIYQVNITVYIRHMNPAGTDVKVPFTVNVEAVTPITAENLALFYIRETIDSEYSYLSSRSDYELQDFFKFPEIQEIDVDLYKVVPCG